MLTRIISGAVLIAVVAAMVCVYLFLDFPYLLIFALALAVAVSTYELTKNAKLVEQPPFIFISSIGSALLMLSFCLYPSLVLFVAVALTLAVVVCTLIFYGKIKNSEIFATIVLPLILSFAFACIYALLDMGILYFLLLLNFSSICDCGAYFVGVTMGKHKLCEKISPKKTVEGAIGGIVSSLIVTTVLCFVFDITNQLLPLLIITPVLCVVGMMGDLFASTIKRNAGIKDYGNLIPGHGGITDRFDSILLIAPVFVLLLSLI